MVVGGDNRGIMTADEMREQQHKQQMGNQAVFDEQLARIEALLRHTSTNTSMTYVRIDVMKDLTTPQQYKICDTLKEKGYQVEIEKNTDSLVGSRRTYF